MDTSTVTERQAMEAAALQAALRWHVEEGIAEPLCERPHQAEATPAVTLPAVETVNPAPREAAPAILGAADQAAAARLLAATANTLDELREAISGFDGLALRRSAVSLVFADGDPAASLMVIGDAPGTDDDRAGVPFTGPPGILLDRMLASIGLARRADDPANAVYLTNLVNWRPPGNRAPTVAEIEISLPFITRHIELARPRLLLLCGSIAAQSLLGRTESVSRLRGKWHAYMPTGTGGTETPISALVTYQPSLLLTTPGHKRATWQDLLMLKARLDHPA